MSRMRKAVEDLRWPLALPFEVGPLLAGSVVLYSHNLIHRGNHRRDDWQGWKNKPRFMWRFWLYRTSDPIQDKVPIVNWQNLGKDVLTGTDRSIVDENVTVVWNYHLNWLHTGKQQGNATDTRNLSTKIGHLESQLRTKGDDNEPTRIGAAYQLARITGEAKGIDALFDALYDDRENVRRAATYGLAVAGSKCTPTLLNATKASVRWVRKAAAFLLGRSRINNASSSRSVIEIAAARSVCLRT